MNNDTENTTINDKFVPITFFTVLALFCIAVIAVVFTFVSIAPKTKASANTLTLKIKTQGIRKAGDKILAHIDFYNGPEKSFEKDDVLFTYKDDAFIGDIILQSNFLFTDRYALFIKPVGFIGKVFCTAELTGDKCITPGFFFLASGSTVDLTSSIFLSGDIPPGNGKIDAQDMSLIMKDLGKTSTADTVLPTDLNGDGIVDVVDYSLAFYSLSNNAVDDEVSLTAPIATSATPAPSVTPEDTIIPTITLAPSPTATPSATPTITPNLTPTLSLTPTATPSATLAPSPTPAH